MKRRLDLGDGGPTVVMPPSEPAAKVQPTSEVRRVDLIGPNQLLVYTQFLSRLICPACNEHGMLTHRVNSITTAFVCQHCCAHFEATWAVRLQGIQCEVNQMIPCPDCGGTGGRSGSGLTQIHCPKCQGFGRVVLPK